MAFSPGYAVVQGLIAPPISVIKEARPPEVVHPVQGKQTSTLGPASPLWITPLEIKSLYKSLATDARLFLLAHLNGAIGCLAVMFLHHLKVGAPVVQQELLMPKGELLFQNIHCIDDCVCICAGAELIFWN